MSKDLPIVAGRSPKVVALKKGVTVAWCACGRSANQPFCDGSHKVTDITPIVFTPEEDKTAYLCMCKHSANKPFCDGTHRTLVE